MQSRNIFESHITLLGGRIRAPRCQALSKRSKLQCGKAALSGKSVCMFHGGISTGPVTKLDRQRSALAQLNASNSIIVAMLFHATVMARYAMLTQPVLL